MVRVYDCHTCRRSHTKISPLSRAALSLFLRAAPRANADTAPGRASERAVEAICFFLISPVAFTAVRELRFLRFARSRTHTERAALLNSRSISTQHPIAPDERLAFGARPACTSPAARGSKGRGRARLIRAQQITACRLARKTAGVLLRRPLAPLDEPAD